MSRARTRPRNRNEIPDEWSATPFWFATVATATTEIHHNSRVMIRTSHLPLSWYPTRSYLTTVKDLIRVMSRLKAVYRSWAIPCAGRDVYYSRHRAEWLGKIKEVGVRRRAEQLYLHLDMLQRSRQQARRE